MAMIFIFPTEMEAAPFRSACPDATAAICGVGMAEAAACVARLNLVDCERVVLAGIAGSYDLAAHPIGEVVEVVAEEIEGLPAQFRQCYEVLPHFSLPSVTSNCVNSSNYPSAHSDIENMEGAAVFAVCEALGVKCSEIRAISNLVGDRFENWSVDRAVESLTKVLITIYNSER